MRIGVTGATGLIGGVLVPTLLADGHEVVVVSRRPARAVRARFDAGSRRLVEGAVGAGRGGAVGEPDAAAGSRAAAPGIGTVARWDPASGEIDAAALEGIDAAVHLAGENIFGVWTARKKERIRRSRVDGTRLFARTLARLDRPPRTLISASGINYYGARRPAEAVDETSRPGHGFLAELCRDWEAATQPAEAAGIRVVYTRFGLVLTPHGGPLRVMLPLFRLGLGGTIGRGDGVWSWVALDDVVGAILHALGVRMRVSGAEPAATEPPEPPDGAPVPPGPPGARAPGAGSDSPPTDRAGARSYHAPNAALSGPVNVVSPNPVTQAEFVRTLARVLRRPAIFRVPEFAVRAALRQQADEMLLLDVHVVPRRLEQTGYDFRLRELEPALRHVLGRR